MTYEEIVKTRNIEIRVAPKGKRFTKLNGKPLKNTMKSVLWFDSNSWVASPNTVTLEMLFFYQVRKGKFDIPSDFDACTRCCGSGNVGSHVDGGVCYKCCGIGYKRNAKA